MGLLLVGWAPGLGDPASVSTSAPPSAHDDDAALEIRLGLHVSILLSLNQAQNQTEIAHRHRRRKKELGSAAEDVCRKPASEAVTRLLVEWKSEAATRAIY
jgi:hypothetical protein